MKHQQLAMTLIALISNCVVMFQISTSLLVPMFIRSKLINAHWLKIHNVHNKYHSYRYLYNMNQLKPRPRLHAFAKSFTTTTSSDITISSNISTIAENAVINNLLITELTNEGVGVGRYEVPSSVTNHINTSSNSLVIMVKDALPGDIVTCRITKNNKKYSTAELISLVKSSPDRVSPFCEYFNVCGGCHYQHLNIKAQHDWKRQQVIDALIRIGKFSDSLVVNQVIASPNSFHYRSKISPHYMRRASNTASNCSDGNDRVNDIIIGFQKRESHDLVEIKECKIAVPQINSALQQLALMKKSSQLFHASNGSFAMRAGDNDAVSVLPSDTVTQTVRGLQFSFGTNDFFQVNPSILPLLIDHLIKHATGESGKKFHLLDAYCGCGLFSLSLAHACKTIIGMELEKGAIENAKLNAKANDISNCRFICGDVKEIFASMDEAKRRSGTLKPKNAKAFPTTILPPALDTVALLDPPRSGCSPQFLSMLLSYGPQRIVYVSCNPTTQARDAAILTNNERYRIVDITPFDMFPQTKHLENVMVFHKV